MDIWTTIGGVVDVELTCADPAIAMSQIYRSGIPVYNAYREDTDIVMNFQIDRRNYPAIRALADKKGYQLKLKRKLGVYWLFRAMLKRPVLMIGLFLFVLVTMYLPSRVLFVYVEGNDTIPTRLILEKSRQCGIAFGVSRAEVRSEKMKNTLLDAIPQLQWAGINTSGCTAVISVRERAEASNLTENSVVSSIVASRDGIITECTATKGNLLCKPGQAVTEGEILISGYTDCGICIRASKAEGEVFAMTERSLSVISPAIWTQKEEKQAVTKKYALIIGKKRINFYKDSGILDTSCDKMYSESYLTLPGGFRLPVILLTEVYTYRESVLMQTEEPTMSEFAQSYLRQQMVSGMILSMSERIHQREGVFCLEGKYICTEMIGRIRNEEIIKPYE